ncbi:MAG: YdcF family protein [Actinobacteria bacterium]|nr:YdcF family protein [Actinomycetota bacterium]
MQLRVLLFPAAAVAGLLAWAELVHRRSSGRLLGVRRATAPVSEAVVVLGYRNRGPRANYVNRFRVRAGLRSFDPAVAERVLVLCGGAVGGPVPEAELMARYARERGYTGPVLLDTESVNTWGNIQRAIPLVEDKDSITIASNPLHGEKARAYLWAQRPDLAARLRRAEDYRCGELLLLKPLAAVVGLANLRRLRAARRPHG